MSTQTRRTPEDPTSDVLQLILTKIETLEKRVSDTDAKVNQLLEHHTPVPTIETPPPSPALPTALTERLQDPDISHTLARLLDKIDTVETAIGLADEATRKLPEILDSVQHESNWTKKIGGTFALLEKLTDPDVTATLGRMMDKLDTVDVALSTLDEGMKKMPHLFESIEQESGWGTKIEGVFALLEKMTDPDVTATLGRMMEKLDSAEVALSTLDEGMKKMPHLFESIEQESSWGTKIEGVFALLEKMTDPDVTATLGRMMEKLDSAEIALSTLDEGMKQMPHLFESIDKESGWGTKIEGVFALLEKMTDPDVTATLGRMMMKLDSAEIALSTLDEGMKQMPQIFESIQNESPLNAQLQETFQLIGKLTEPETLRAVSGLVDKMGTAELLLKSVDELLHKMPHLLESIQNESGSSEILMRYIAIAEQLADPRVVGSLEHLLSKIHNLDAVLNILDAVVSDNPELRQENSSLVRNIRDIVRVLAQAVGEDDKGLIQTIVGGLSILQEVNQIILSPKTRVIIEGVSLAMEQKRDELPKVGVFGMLKQLNNEDIKKALGLLVVLLQSIGQRLEALDCEQIAQSEA